MGLEYYDLLKISELRSRHSQKGDLCILGNCVFHFNQTQLVEKSIVDYVNIPNARVCLEDFSRAMGFNSCDTIDRTGNPTILMDLCGEMPEKYYQRYDWIIDAGTMCCCFDPVAVLKNIHYLLKPGGFIIHLSYLFGYIGRGYHSFQPAFYHDYYGQAAYNIEYMGYRVKPSYCREGFKNRIYGLLTRFNLVDDRRLQWQQMSPKCLFLKSATKYALHWSFDYQVTDPDFIPNNVLLMCAVLKKDSSSFIVPRSSGYSS